MKPTDDLFQLIHSLSKSEKRYFSIYYSGKNVYQKIFGIIEKQEEYDEKELLEKLNICQIHVYKNYLHKLILKSLRSFHAESSESVILFNQLQNFEILFDRGLFKQAKKTLMKCKTMALETQNRDILGEIYQLEQKLVFLMPRQKEEYVRSDFVRQREILNEKFGILWGQYLAYQISKHFYRTGLLLNEEIKNDIIAINDSLDEIKSQSNEFLIYKNWIKYLYNFMTVNFQDAFDAAERFIYLIDHSERNFDLSILSCEVAYSHATCTLKIKEINDYYFINGKFPDDFLIQLPDGHLAGFVIKIMNLYLFYEVGKYQEGLTYIKSILENNRNEVNEVLIVTYHAAATLHFCTANYKEALRYCNKVINECRPGVSDDFYFVNLLIRIIIHFELKNYEVVEDLIRKIKSHLKKHDFFHPLDEILLSKLQDAMIANTQKEFILHMRELDQKFESLGPKFENSTKLKVYFNFKDWIHAKAINKNFAETILESRTLLLKQMSGSG